MATVQGAALVGRGTDPLTVPVTDISTIRVRATYVDGQRVHAA